MPKEQKIKTKWKTELHVMYDEKNKGIGVFPVDPVHSEIQPATEPQITTECLCAVAQYCLSCGMSSYDVVGRGKKYTIYIEEKDGTEEPEAETED